MTERNQKPDAPMTPTPVCDSCEEPVGGRHTAECQEHEAGSPVRPLVGVRQDIGWCEDHGHETIACDGCRTMWCPEEGHGCECDKEVP